MEYRDARIAHVVALMAMHRSDPLQVEELARKVNLSPSYLTRLFRDETGSAPVTFDRAQRLDRAHDLIRKLVSQHQAADGRGRLERSEPLLP